VIEPLRPARGGFLRPFGCAWFIQEFLLGNGPTGSPIIDPDVGAPMVDIHRHYKESLKRDEGSKGTSQETIERMHIPTKSPLKMPLKIGKRKQLLHLINRKDILCNHKFGEHFVKILHLANSIFDSPHILCYKCDNQIDDKRQANRDCLEIRALSSVSEQQWSYVHLKKS
jgi:hypothetical protein